MFATRLLHLGPLQVKFNWIVAVFVVLLMGGLIRLGIWQLDRAAEKNAGKDQVLQLQAQKPRPIEGLFDGSISTQDNDLSTVNLSLHGSYTNDKAIWVANQTYQEQIGYEVLSPFRLASNNKLILVSRGWVSARAWEQPKSHVVDIEGVVDLTGLLVTKPFTFEQPNKIDTVSWPLRLAHVDTQEISTLLGESVFPYIVRLNDGSPGLMIRHWKTINVNVDKNYSYALQWFAMAIAVLIVSLYLSSNIGTLFSGRTEEIAFEPEKSSAAESEKKKDSEPA